MKNPGAQVAWLAVFLAAAVQMPAAQKSSSPHRAVSAAPAIDKAAVIRYLRYAEGFTPQVEITVDDPKPSFFPDFYEIHVRLKADRNQAVRTYYMTTDGQRLVSGSIFDLHQSPFASNLPLLKEEGAPAVGPANAPIQIYVFSDFECPYCREEAKILRQSVQKEHPNDVRIIFKDFPIDAIHPWARKAAIAGQCIAEQNPEAFWTFHDWVYEHQPEVNPGNVQDKIAEFAKTQKIDTAKLAACEAGAGAADRVARTLQEGQLLSITQTPTMFVNGRMLSGALSADQMNLLIKMELEHKQQAGVTVQQKCCEVSIPSVTKAQ